jgi:hypothetical protein
LRETGLNVLPKKLCRQLASVNDTESGRKIRIRNEIELCAAKKQTTPGVNFAKILRVAFASKFLRQKSSNLKFKYQKASGKTFV